MSNDENKPGDSSAKIERAAELRKSLLIAVVPAIIGLCSALVGNIIGQRIAAVSDTNKIVRDKLEVAFYKAVTFSELATNLNKAALPDKLSIDSKLAMGIYNDEAIKFNDLVHSITSIVDMYGDELEQPSAKLQSCSREFIFAAVDLFALRMEVFKAGDYGTPAYIEAAKKVNFEVRQNAVVVKRQECENAAANLRKRIKMEIKKQLARSVI